MISNNFFLYKNSRPASVDELFAKNIGQSESVMTTVAMGMNRGPVRTNNLFFLIISSYSTNMIICSMN